MKNLPDKIYLNLNMTPQEVVETRDKDFHETTKTWEITWSEECLSEHDPEYVFKDAFTKKACEGIEHLLSGYIIRNFHFGDSYDMDTLLKDFRKYLED